MATPLTGSCVAPAAIISSGSGDGGYAAATAFSGVSSALAYVKHSALKYPILAFLFFHKALRWELEKLHRDALALEKDCCGLHQIRALLHRYRFLRDIYKHHSNAEDEVIFPALDERVKNVALTYSLEHKGESDLFDQVFELLNSALKSNSSHHSFKLRRELICCTEAIQTSLCQHMGKEEEQVFPLLVEHFSFKEQAALVWQFMCSIPVNLMEEFLSWLVSSLSTDECQDMMRCMMKIVPEEPLLQQVVFTWLKGKNTCYDFENPLNEGNNERQTFKVSLLSNSAITVSSDHSSSRNECCEKNCKISNVVTSNHAIGNGHLLNQFPIDEIVYWHNAIRKEVKELAGEARHMQFSGDFSNLVAFNERLQFVADVCIFHSIAEDKLVFPAVDEKVRSEVCFINEHAQEENQFDDFRRLIDEKFHDKLCFGSSSGWSDFHDKLCSYADQIVQMIEKHFLNEEEEVLPLARKHCATDEQRHLLYQSLRVMPLRLLERVLPWLVKSLEEEEAKVMLQNMRLAAPASDMALVTLLSGWACKGRPRHNSNRWKYVCISSDSANDCPVKKINEISSRMNDDCDANITALDLKGTKHCLPELATEQARKRSKEDRGIFDKDSAETAPCSSGVSCSSQPCCVPGLGVSGSTLCAGTSSTGRNLRSLSFNSSAGASLSSNYSVGSDCGSYDNCQASKPIDLIFQFHKAIRKDLEHLDVESTKLMDCDEAFLRHFSGRFRLLWSLYTAHSNAEDEIVFPALESKESLHNVSHAYTLDHKQEEQLFNDISHVISDLVKLHEDSTTSASTGDWKVRHHELAAKLQRMCKSIRVTLDQHVFREELELWPLFDKHFTIEEQDKIIGRIIGTSGAEVLQSMLPWVTGALTQVEKNVMMDAWRQAARNTMFDEWLSAWWTDSSSLSSHSSSFTEQTNMSAAGTMPCENLEQRFQKFKPGWKDIFRMNQNELESAIRKVSSDTSLDPRQKAYLIQNLMTSRWIAAQQKLSQSKSLNESGSNEDLPGRCPSYRDSEQKVFGCEHYKRNCKLRAACCDQLFTCRFCHDKVSDHMMDRKATKEMMCMACLQLQPVAANCINPSCNGLTMAKYFCSICKLYDDEREIYHCPFCNLCRVGRGLGVDFFHCMTCNACMSKTLAVHRCREKGLESNCPICHDFLFTSSAPVKALPCGHFMHSSCFQAYTCSHYTCPICSKSLGDMAVYFGMLDALLSAEELPEEYRGRTQDILCNDCEQKGTAPFHWLYHKCGSCGSYNTRVI